MLSESEKPAEKTTIRTHKAIKDFLPTMDVAHNQCQFCVKLTMLFTFSLCSQLRYDRYDAAAESIISGGQVEEMPSRPAIQIPVYLLRPLIVGKLDKGKEFIIIHVSLMTGSQGVLM